VLIDLKTPPVTLSTWVFLPKGNDSSITPPGPIFSQLTALIVAAAGELSSLSLIAYPANLAIPLTRFAGFAWLTLVGGLLPTTLRRTESHPKKEAQHELFARSGRAGDRQFKGHRRRNH